jgi:hypothetical protein
MSDMEMLHARVYEIMDSGQLNPDEAISAMQAIATVALVDEFLSHTQHHLAKRGVI